MLRTQKCNCLDGVILSQRPKTCPQPRIPAARPFFVILCFSVLSSARGNPEVGGRDNFSGSYLEIVAGRPGRRPGGRAARPLHLVRRPTKLFPTPQSICLSVYLSICLSVYLSICLSVYLSIYLSLSLSISLSLYLSLSLYSCRQAIPSFRLDKPPCSAAAGPSTTPSRSSRRWASATSRRRRSRRRPGGML